jgi:hypothetical protein
MNLFQLAADLERNKKEVGFRAPTFIEILHSLSSMNLLQLAANLERNKKEVGFRAPTFIEILHSSLSSLISLPLKHRLDFSFLFSAPLPA